MRTNRSPILTDFWAVDTTSLRYWVVIFAPSHLRIPWHGQGLHEVASSSKAFFGCGQARLPVAAGTPLVCHVDDWNPLAVPVGRVLNRSLVPAHGMRDWITLEHGNAGPIWGSLVGIDPDGGRIWIGIRRLWVFDVVFPDVGQPYSLRFGSYLRRLRLGGWHGCIMMGYLQGRCGQGCSRRLERNGSAALLRCDGKAVCRSR